MSMKLMVRILEEADLTRPQQAVLVAMAESANDDGSRCYPSTDLIAWKAGYKPRNVIDIIRELRHMGVLEVVKESTQRHPIQYQIHVDKAPRKMTFDEWQKANGRHVEKTPRGAISREVQNDEGCNLTSPEVQNDVSNSRENAPNPVIDPIDPATHGEQPSNVVHVSPPPPKPPREKKRPEHGPAQRIMAAFCDAVGIERLPNYDRAGGTARNLVSAGVTAEDIPDMVAWCFEQEWLKGGIDLDTLYRNVVRWKTDRMDRPKRKGGPPVDLLPGETAIDMGNGEWELNHPSGYKRVIKPSYHGVIWDTRKHTGYDGMQAFNAAVKEAKAKAERNEVAA